MKAIITHFTDDDLYKFTMCCAVIDNYPRARVKYIFQDRDNRVYPAGFARELAAQVEALDSLRITEAEISFMKRRCPYIPFWFYSFLKGFRYDHRHVRIRQDALGHLEIAIEGDWTNVILFEVKILALVSELYYIMTGLNSRFDYNTFAAKSRAKARALIANDCVFSDFGTRRRASFEAQKHAVGAITACQQEMGGEQRFMGTSNVYLAMENNLTPMGTMAHEFICALGGMYGPQMANHLAMKAWSSTYRGSLGTFLYDTFGWEIFSLNFSEDYANMFKGLRVDSGDNLVELERIAAKYRSLDIDPATKNVIFSNNLTTDAAIAIRNRVAGRCKPAFGIGTHFTNDFDGIAPLNIVIKLVAAKITESWPFYNETCKLSEDAGKNTGNPEVIARFKRALHMD